MMAVKPAAKPKNTALRQPPNTKEGAVERPARTEAPTQKRARRAEAAIVDPDTPMFPAGSLVDNLLCNKAVRNKGLIFKQSVIGPRGMRQYQYEIEDTGQCIWAYRPLGAWQGS
jgi:hypothetical protein